MHAVLLLLMRSVIAFVPMRSVACTNIGSIRDTQPKLIRQATVNEFVRWSCVGQPLESCAQAIRRHSTDRYSKSTHQQIWEEVLDENSVRPKTGLRMPYNEKADDVLDKQMPERQRLWRSGELHMVFFP